MLLGKEIKNVFPYFNKIITETQKLRSLMEVKAVGGQLIFTLLESASLSIIYSIPFDDGVFTGLFFDYKSLASAFSKIKTKDEVEISSDGHRLKVSVNGEEKIVVSTGDSNLSGSSVDFICEITEYNLLKTIEENKVFANKGSMPYNSNIFFSLKNNNLNVYNTNDVAMTLNTMSVENAKGEYVFAIENDNVSTLYKWINAIKNLKIEIALSKEFVFFKTKNEVLKLANIKPHNLDLIIENFEKMANVEFDMLSEEKLSDVKNEILEKAKKLDKENNFLKLSIDFKSNSEDISLAKKLFTETLKFVAEDSTLGLIDNPIQPVLITNIEEGLNHKIIFNTIH